MNYDIVEKAESSAFRIDLRDQNFDAMFLLRCNWNYVLEFTFLYMASSSANTFLLEDIWGKFEYLLGFYQLN